MSDPTGEAGGLFAMLRRLAESVTALVHHRLELISLDLQEEKLRLVGMLARLAAMVVLGFLALGTATGLVVVLLWEWSPAGAFAVLTGLYGILALALGLGVRNELKSGSRPFHDTLDQFQKDKEWLTFRRSKESATEKNG